jgi:hypothetical protein
MTAPPLVGALLVGSAITFTLIGWLSPAQPAPGQPAQSAPGQPAPGQPLRAQPPEALPELAPPVAADPPADLPTNLGALFEALASAVPKAAADYDSAAGQAVRRAAQALDERFAELALYRDIQPNQQPLVVRRAESLVAIKARVDALLDSTLDARRGLVALPEDSRRAAINSYLVITTELIDLSGRLRYTLFDGLYDAAVIMASQPPLRDQLIETLIAHKSSIGADVMSDALFDPPSDAPNGARPASPATKSRMLELIAVTGQTDVMPLLGEFIADPLTPPALVLEAAETVVRVGLPQSPRPGQDPALGEPRVTGRSLLAAVEAIPPDRLSPAERTRRDQCIGRLRSMAEKGLTEDVYRWAGVDIRPGDWLLMRNPSPYNLFTDLSPGLFTHVGVVTTETGPDGVRRMVLVDLPEVGSRMQSTTLDTFVLRTLHFVVLRHADPTFGPVMADVARQVIDAPTRFDLNFRTNRVAALRGKPLAGETIHTYCAGLLLLCAQETGAARSAFFPIPEGPAGGKTVANLQTLGLSFGDDFISPTGAFYSTSMQIVARRTPMYEPGREIEQSIYDHFCNRLIGRDLKPTDELYQSLRVKFATAVQANPLLASAAASAAGFGDDVDLVAAAKAAAVVETLDEVAMGASREFFQARRAVLAAPEAELGQAGLTEDDIALIRGLRERHPDLVRRLDNGQLTPRELRVELVRFYVERGRTRLDDQFFGGS